jgi:hypothetical protein
VPAFARRGFIAERRLDRLRRAGLALLEVRERHLPRRSACGIFGATKCRQMLSVVSPIILPAGVAGRGSWLMCCLGHDLHTVLCGARRSLILILGHLRVLYCALFGFASLAVLAFSAPASADVRRQLGSNGVVRGRLTTPRIGPSL